MANGSLGGRVVYLRNKCSGLVLDGGPEKNLCQWGRNDPVTAHQLFKLVHITGDKYNIICQKNGKAVDLSGYEDKDGAEILTWDFHGGSNQQWHFEAAGGGGFFIRSAVGGRVLDVPNLSTRQGCNLCLWEKNGGDNQVFYADFL